MIGVYALTIEGRVDRIERLHRDPPVTSERTAWGVDRIDGELVLIESAVISCPDCGQKSLWARGVAACPHCQQSHRLVG